MTVRTLLRAAFVGAELEAAGRVALTPAAPGPFGAIGWGTGGERLAPFTFTPPTTGFDRPAAMTVPTVSRSRDLLCTAVGNLPFRLHSVDAGREGPEIDPAGWMARPDPNRTRQSVLAWTVDDLFFYGVAFWRITRRYQNTYPATFARMPVSELTIDERGIRWRGDTVKPDDVVEFASPIDGLLTNGYRAISIALQLDAAAERFSASEIPAGYLQQTGGEPMTALELAEMADGFTARRRINATAALNETVAYRETTLDPGRLQLVEGRDHQALELARLANIPPYLVGAPSGSSFTYQNAEQARADLIDFGAMPYLTCLEQTLSGPNVTPSTELVRLDVDAWLRSPFTGDDPTGAAATPAPPPPGV